MMNLITRTPSIVSSSTSVSPVKRYYGKQDPWKSVVAEDRLGQPGKGTESDSGASVHMISKRDLKDAEMDTLTKSCSSTIIIFANGEVQTHEETTVYVKELYIFLTMKVLENTSAVLSLGKLCDENGYSYEWINGQKTLLIKNGIRTPCNTENFVLIVVPGLSTNSSSGSDSSTSKTPSRQESHSSSFSSTSFSSSTVGEIQTRKREDRTESDFFQ